MWYLLQFFCNLATLANLFFRPVWRFPAMFCHAGPSLLTHSNFQIQISKNGLQLKLKLHQLWRIAMWLSHDYSYNKAVNFKLQLIFVRMMWVFGHFFTCPSTWFQYDWRKCNPIKILKVNGDGRKHRSVREVFFSRLQPTAEDLLAFGDHRKFPPHAKKTFWYLGYLSRHHLQDWHLSQHNSTGTTAKLHESPRFQLQQMSETSYLDLKYISKHKYCQSRIIFHQQRYLIYIASSYSV